METTDDGSTEKQPRGRPVGSSNKFSKQARAMAEATGELPHEFLLRIARGEPILHKSKNPVTGEFEDDYVIPRFEDRMDCAKAAAPYFAPKFATVEITQRVSDDELDKIIASLAAETGFSNSSSGEGQEKQGIRTAPGQRRRLNQV